MRVQPDLRQQLYTSFTVRLLFETVNNPYGIYYSLPPPPNSLQNTSGQTAADLAYSHGFHHCFHLISKSQLRALPVNEVQNGDGAPRGLDLRSRKRLLTSVDCENSKRVRRAGGMCLIENTTMQHEVQTWWLSIFVVSLCRRCIIPDGEQWRWGTRENEHRCGTWASSRWDWNPSKYVEVQMLHQLFMSCSIVQLYYQMRPKPPQTAITPRCLTLSHPAKPLRNTRFPTCVVPSI